MDTSRMVAKALTRKVRSASDRFEEWLEFTEHRTHFRSPLDRKERRIWRDFSSFLLNGHDFVIYDIGAYKGTYTTFFAKSRSVRAVIAFEPIPDIFHILSARTGELENVSRYNVALGDKNEIATLYRSSFSASSSLLPMGVIHKQAFPHSSHITNHPVTVVTLDDFVVAEALPVPDLIKIDVQGFEHRVLDGGRHTISKARYCVLEMSMVPLYEGSLLFDDMFERMRELGFSLIGITGLLNDAQGRTLSVDGVFERARS